MQWLIAPDGRLRSPVRKGMAGWRIPARFSWIVLVIALGASAGRVAGQSSIRDFGKPILVHNGGGHSAELRVLAFADDRTLLSAGMDKIVNVWDFSDGRERLSATLRPPIFRGLAGSIYAMALSSSPDAEGQRVLAVAGYGVESSGGEITLYAYPKLLEPEGNAPLARITDLDPNVAPEERIGHRDVVRGLSVSPDGRMLASCSLDGTVRIWDIQDRPPTPVAVLNDHVGGVQAVVFLPDGQRVASAGDDGIVRIWNWRNHLISRSPRPENLSDDQLRINTLVVDPSGRFVVAGRENGLIIRYETANLNGFEFLNRDDLDANGRLTRGSIEALAISPDGAMLAVSVLKFRSENEAELPRSECDIVLRRFPDGRRLRNLVYTRGRALGLAFSPDGSRLAIGGGDRQAVYVADPRQALADQQMMTLAGDGTTLWDVGFLNQGGTSIAYSRRRPLEPDEPRSYEGFDLAARSAVSVEDADEIRGALDSFEGWVVRPTGIYTLELIGPDGQVRTTIELDRVRERRWWCYSFLPPSAGREELLLAVGCEGGVVVYRARDGRKTRVFAGHEGPVLALAPSADGRWLATASDDQTIRLWSLVGVDQRPPLGATFRRDDQGRWEVSEVVDGSMADLMGLDEGDQVDEAGIEGVNGNAPVPIDQFVDLVDESVPNRLIYLQVIREGEPDRFPVGTTKRDSPLLSYYPGIDREWVLWMPEGYYDTSIAGDHRLIGWHVNPPIGALMEPTRFHPLSRYEEQLLRPEAIDTLLRTADRDAALVLAQGGADEAPVRVLAPPTITFEAVPEQIQAPELTIAAIVTAAESRVIRSLSFRIGTRELGRLEPEEPSPSLRAERELTLQPGTNRIVVEAVDNQGVSNTEMVRVVFEPPAPPEPPRSPLLVIRSIGVEGFGEKVPSIASAAQDAEQIAAFLAAPTDRPRFPETRIDRQVLGTERDAESGPSPTSDQIAEVFEDLRERADSGSLKAGDSVFVALESHLVVPPDGKGPPVLLGSDATGEVMPAPTLDSGLVAEALERLSSEGCLVVFLLDGLHHPDWIGRGYDLWVRDLAYRRGVIVMVASKQQPSERLATLGAFAQSVIESAQVRARIRPMVDPDEPITLDDFRAAVIRRVAEMTSNRQVADLYFDPDSFALPGEIAIFDPQLPEPKGFASNE
ncbi:WD40 repeat domain-containing protein [Tautonia marina]|uniref:WD40 repeat domain-containing protein n=1 Tax=Tautonia marina TaxID=2653855 RepID=UPI0012611434|nr:hypothetical protein [Tautonia marina]